MKQKKILKILETSVARIGIGLKKVKSVDL